MTRNSDATRAPAGAQDTSLRLARGDSSEAELRTAQFRRVQAVVQSHLGIDLPKSKKAMVQGRLRGILAERGIDSFKEYCDRFLDHVSPSEVRVLADRMSTNFTFFNREAAHFELLQRTVLPEILARQRRSKDLRIWCAAAASGEEPYTLCMLAREVLGGEYSLWDAGVLATDISEEVLATARAGVYETSAVERLPTELQRRYFEPVGGARRVKDDVRRDVVFRRFNLHTPKFPFQKPFHVIFCRNVMIYFQDTDKAKLVQKLHDATAPGGYLFVGHAETLSRSQSAYEFVRPGVYRRRAA